MDLRKEFKAVIDKTSEMQRDELIELFNDFKLIMHEASPFKSEPVDCVLWVSGDTVKANDYNPNNVAPPEMELLRLSIANDGYTQPIVSMIDQADETQREVIDGFHRNRVGKECKEIQDRIHGYLPVVTIRESQTGLNDRVASTIRHNRARGKHQVTDMSNIVADLKKRNWSNKKISKELGMDADEVLRLSQISGLTELFKDVEFTKAWEEEPGNDVIQVDRNELDKQDFIG